ncbi:unnamed protein product [Rhizoctonia solani]|uniref:Uncharacterized protein n=1 Tax=Rhizoctonia solani TaxID=456999 RepID=A0A8H3DDG0_9AGAM|nr:unnamed protein product [Rhizoctonia solani]
MRLSQHLFGAQMAVYRAEYSKALLPGDQSIYAPPALPSHIPGALERVVGSPSDNDIKATQNALRDVDSLAVSTLWFLLIDRPVLIDIEADPRLFDADLSMKLSQHLFNIQFARYMHNSAQGEFASGGEGEESVSASHPTPEQQGPTSEQIPDIENGEQSNPRVPRIDRVLEAPPEPTQLGEVMQAMKDTMNRSGDTLENINRMLVSIKRDQCMGYVLHGSQHWQKDPLNRQGVLASECGLPRLRYMYNPNNWSWSITLAEDHIAGYLKFFDIGTDLIQGDEEPKLIAGKKGEAEKLLLAEVTR